MKIFEHGSTWLKVDSHLHTKADKKFKYTDRENDFVRLYIDALEKRSINVGFITNHNKFDRDEYKALKKAAFKEDIYLLPGTELSIDDGKNGIHCLIICNPETWLSGNDNFIEQFLVSAFEGKANRENANARCNYDLSSLFQKLEEHRKDGRDSFIIMAHAEQDNGFCHELDGGRIGQMVNDELFLNNVLAFQKVRTADIVTKLKQWFDDETRIPPFIEGSDPKGIDEVGGSCVQTDEHGVQIEKCTYIKIGDFNFEAIKYALIDKKNRIYQDSKPASKNSFIKSLHVESSMRGLLKNANISFSQELNNLIGIRGSGKSAIIEILRYTLGISLSKQAAERDYKNSLVDYVIKSGGKISVEVVDRHGKAYRIERIYGQREDIFVGDERIDASINAIFKPVVYFGQKDLSNKDIDFEANLVDKLIGIRLEEVRSKISAKKIEVTTLLEESNKLKNLEELKLETNAKKVDTEQRLKIFKEKNVEQKLRTQNIYESDQRRINDILSGVKEFCRKISSDIEEHNVFFSETAINSEVNAELFKKAESTFSIIKKEVDVIRSSLKKIESQADEFASIYKEIEDKKESLKEEFAKIKREIEIPNLNPDEFLELNRIIDASVLKLKEIDKSETKRTDLKKKIEDKLYELNNLWKEEYSILENEVGRINLNNPQLKIEIEFKARKDKFIEKQKEVFRGSGISESNYKKIADEYMDFIEIYKDDGPLKTILNDNQYIEYKKRLVENSTELLTFQVENRFTINYNGKPLKDHSLGQRATALILFLLAQKDTDVLIIDQPEDDLDNQTIYQDVIKEIKSLKGQMQFIFATHNANIPVLGDSEKIIACSYTEEEIKAEEGTIDNGNMQKTIVNIMEGGNEAFRRRKDIYTLWKVEG